MKTSELCLVYTKTMNTRVRSDTEYRNNNWSTCEFRKYVHGIAAEVEADIPTK